MSHLIFNSPYDFYDLSEDERIKLIGRVYKERMLIKGKYTIRPHIYIPIGLASDEFNYGIQQGVLVVTPVWTRYKDQFKWFKVGVFSPDDLDMDLEFGPKHIHLRQEVIDFIRGSMHKKNRRYREVLEQIQRHFDAGILTQ